jgi:hypothetical protein
MPYHLRTEKTWDETRAALAETMRKWRVTQWQLTKPSKSVTTAYAYTRDARRVTLRYVKDGAEVVLHMDKQSRVVDNARVLYLAVEAMRLNDERGIADVVREAYAQLPPPADEQPRRDPYEVLGVREDSPWEVVEAAYRARMKTAHPDTGGSAEAMKEVQAAMEQLRRQRGK